MKAEIGDQVIEGTGFGYVLKVITGRTTNTIATRHPNGSTSDHRAKLYNFRAYDKAKVNRILQLEVELFEKRTEQSELYQSLERLE